MCFSFLSDTKVLSDYILLCLQDFAFAFAVVGRSSAEKKALIFTAFLAVAS